MDAANPSTAPLGTIEVQHSAPPPPPQSIVSVPQLTFGATCGICAGVFVKKGFKLVAFLLGGVFVLLQYLSSRRFVTVDWSAVSKSYDGAIATVDENGKIVYPTPQGVLNGLIDFLTANFQRECGCPSCVLTPQNALPSSLASSSVCVSDRHTSQPNSSVSEANECILKKRASTECTHVLRAAMLMSCANIYSRSGRSKEEIWTLVILVDVLLVLILAHAAHKHGGTAAEVLNLLLTGVAACRPADLGVLVDEEDVPE
jgi:FUN14 domain-containing protein 1